MGSRATKARPGVVPALNVASEPAVAEMAASYALQPYRYNSAKHSWEKLDLAGEGHKVNKTSLRLATYNVFFGQNTMRGRFRHILSMLPELDADVICVQEANMEWIEEMTDNEYVQQHYFASDVNGRTFNGYGVVILSRIPMADLTMWKLPTSMGRRALIATYTINEETVSIGTVHLESLDSAQLRAEQLEKISGILASSPHAGLMGDFNFDSDRNFRKGVMPLENDNIAAHYPDYVDVWPTLRPEEKGYTFDSEVNRMIRQFEQMRYDRVLWKSAGGQWRPKRIELFGTAPMKGHIGVWPSDHFGLVTDLEFVAQAEPEPEPELADE